MTEIRSYRDLQVWQRAMQLAESVYRVGAELPPYENYGLRAQMLRSAVSVPSNIAEGHARDSTKDFLRFVSISQGSLAELETQLLLAERFGYAEGPQIADVLQQTAELGRMLSGLQAKLRLRLSPGP